MLQRAGLTEQQAIDRGAILSAVLQWDCGAMASPAELCKPHLTVRDISGEGGKSMTRSWATYHGSESYRDLHQARGLRILLTSQGYGEAVDPLQVGMQLFVMLALFPVCAAPSCPLMTSRSRQHTLRNRPPSPAVT